MGIEMDLVQATLDAVQTLLSNAGNAAGKQAVSAMFACLHRTPEARQPDAAAALDALYRGEASAADLQLVYLLLSTALERDRQLIGLAADVRRRANITMTKTTRSSGSPDSSTIQIPARTTGFNDGSMIRDDVFVHGDDAIVDTVQSVRLESVQLETPSWESAEWESAGWDSTRRGSANPLPAGGPAASMIELVPHPPSAGPLRVSPSVPLRLTVDVINRSTQHQIVVLDTYGPGRQAVSFPVSRIRLRGLETFRVDVHLTPDQQLSPDIYTTQLRAYPEAGDARPATAPLRFTVLPDPTVNVQAHPDPEDHGAAEVLLLNTGNTELQLTVSAVAGGKTFAVDPAELTLPVGTYDLLRVHLRRSLFSARQIEFDLVLNESSGLRIHERLTVTLPPVSRPAEHRTDSDSPTAAADRGGSGPRSRAESLRRSRSPRWTRRPVVAGVAAVMIVAAIGVSTRFEDLFGSSNDEQPVAGALLPKTGGAPGDQPCPKIAKSDRAPAKAPSTGLARSATMAGAVNGGVKVASNAGLVLVGSSDWRVHAFAVGSLKERWYSPCLEGPVLAQPTVSGSNVYAVTANGTVYEFALKARGEQKIQRVWRPGGQTAINATVTDDTLIATVATQGMSALRMYSTVNGIAIPGVMFDEEVVQSPTLARKARLYVAHDVASLSVLTAPKQAAPPAPVATLASRVPGARLRYLSIRANPRIVGSSGQPTEMVVATGEVDPTLDDDVLTAVDRNGQSVPAPGVLVNWPTGVKKQARSPIVVGLPGVPVRPALTVRAKRPMAFVSLLDGPNASLVTVDLQAGKIVRQQQLDPARSRPGDELVGPSTPVLATGYVAVTWGRCLYVGHRNRSDLRAVFCDSADLPGQAGFDNVSSPSSVFVAGHSGRLRKIAL